MKTEQKLMSIDEFYQRQLNGEFEIDSEYQRGAAWTLKQKKLLIDSLMRGYPIPMFYFHQKTVTTSTEQTTKWFIVDGQQRRNAIREYLDNEFPLFDHTKDRLSGIANFHREKPTDWAGKKFNQLPDALQQQLRATMVNISVVHTENADEVRDLFVRLQGGSALSAQEKRDAWPGNFTEFICEVGGKKAGTGHDFFRTLVKGSDNRGNMRKNCAALFMQLYSRRANEYSPGSFTSTTAPTIDNFYKYHIKFDKDDSAFHGPRFLQILDEATDLLKKGGFEKVELHMAHNVVLLVDRLLDDFGPNWRGEFILALIEFHKRIVAAKKEKSASNRYWADYGSMVGQAAASSDSARKRFRFFEREMIGLMPGLRLQDAKKELSPSLREMMYFYCDGNCSRCGEQIDWDEGLVEYRNADSSGDGGLFSNARLVHNHCRDVNALNMPLAQDSSTSGELPWDDDAKPPRNTIGSTANRPRTTFRGLHAKGLLKDGCVFIYGTGVDSVSAIYRPPSTFEYRADGKVRVYDHFNKIVFDHVGSRNIWKTTVVEFPNGESIPLHVLRELYWAICESEKDESDDDGV